MEPTFLISFDCEGKWGMADCLNPDFKSRLTAPKLTDVYARLTDLLDRHEIRASFGFVGLFTLSPDEWRDIRSWAIDALIDRDYLRSFLDAEASGDFAGWFAPGVAEMIANHLDHEFCAHGFSHCFYDPEQTSHALADLDLEALRKLPLFREKKMTFIFPRNVVGHRDLLLKHGFTAFRKKRTQMSGAAGRLMNLTQELKAHPKPEEHPKASLESATGLPAGYFLNWRSGARARIPISTTVRRWRGLVDGAIASGSVAHLWSHPHNFIDYPGMFEQFDAILGYAAERIRAGDLRNPTMLDYATAVRGEASSNPPAKGEPKRPPSAHLFHGVTASR